jgi:hypothetical protein
MYSTRKTRSRNAMATAAFNTKNIIVTSTLDFNLRKKIVKFYIWSIALYGVETWTLQKANHKYLESSDV